MKLPILSIAVMLAIAATTVQAHHSIAGAYDSKREVTLDGIVAEFSFVNPHPFVLVEVKTRGGEAQRWKVEMDNRSELSGVGMTKDTLKPGDRIIVRGNPANELPQTLYIRRLDRPVDGFRYEQIGNSPRINFK